MNTDQLIAALSNGVEPVDPGAARRNLMLAAAAGFVAGLPLLLTLLGINPRLAQAALLPMFWVKLAFVGGLAAAGWWTVFRLSRPGAALGAPALALAAPVLVMGALALAAMLLAQADQRLAVLLGSSWTVCPWRIAVLAMPAFVLMLWAVKGLAPTRLRLAGAGAGMLAGAIGALVYLLYCPEMAPPFLLVWYTLGMLLPAALGALVGPRVLRW
ncbi:MAG: NrsF family protein [bacterium]